MKNKFYARKTRQLSYRIKLLKNYSTPHDQSSSKFNSLVSEIKLLLRDLKYCISRRRIQKIIGGAALLLGLGLATTAEAQQFGDRTVNPFGISLVTEAVIRPTLADLDGDGDFDLITADYYNGGIGFSENIGTAQSPSFAPELFDQFGLPSGSYIIPFLGDLDNDGDLDLLAFSYSPITFDPETRYYENVGSPSDPSFSVTPIINPFNLGNPTITFGQLADLDGDGDLDLIASEEQVVFYENTGTANAPAFAPVQDNSFGLNFPSNDSYTTIAFSDVDLDGDMDVIAVEFYQDNDVHNFMFKRNNGDAQNPNFGEVEINPLGLAPLTNSVFNIPTMADLDGDGDEDLLVSAHLSEFGSGNEPLHFNYYELVSTVGIETVISNNTTTIFPNPTSNILTIQSDIAIQSYEVFDIVGHTILSENFNGQTINVKSLNTGIYILKMKNEKDEIVVKRFEKI